MDDETRDFLTDYKRMIEFILQWTPRAKGERLMPILAAHLDNEPAASPLVVEQLPMSRFIDIDIALEILREQDPQSQLVGVADGSRHHNTIGELIAESGENGLIVGHVDRQNFATGPDSERATVSYGLHLFRFEGRPVVICQRAANPRYGLEDAQLEVLATETETARAVLAKINALSIEHSVLRGQVITFARSDYERVMSGITFIRRPEVDAAQVILPAGSLEQISLRVIGLAAHRDRLLAAGQHLKRGILLYGPPGTGKTHTVRYLIGASPGSTVILLSGSQMHHVGEAANIARAHQPAIVVLEDCDLIAEDRDFSESGSPLLFSLLDAMDGLDADADVVFLLTTNRAETLERALAERPASRF